ncbi:MAG TPA: DNA topoisomerase, partial [Candidatus Saccharimonadales bacterium]|nr:DNA topoisomerase [Candidatus Saccharimonadales bacterium]
LDRLVGYELSPVLWKKVRPGLSAGRVQSVAVRLIVEREREIKDFAASSTYKVLATFSTPKGELVAELTDRLESLDKAKKFLEASKNAVFTITDVAKKPGTRNPGAPFTTSSLQQEAARRLGFSVKQTMTLAQRLYESGHITYMRTDSTTLSGFAIKAAEEQIVKAYGKQYHQVRQYQTKSKNAQEAHEAIRPTSFSKTTAGDDAQQKRLYELVWQRAIASQMAAAGVDRTEVTINSSSGPESFIAKGEILTFDGFLKVYGGGKADTLLPEVKQGQKLDLQIMTANQTHARPPARYSEASLVKKLEELGIGRPSTYAPTISTIQTRGYIEKGDLEGEQREAIQLTLEKGKISQQTVQETYGADQNKLLPTPMADVTTDFLVKHFASIVDYDFTAKAEEDFDDIADGKQQWVKTLEDFYKHFHPLITKSEKVSREDSMQSRPLGKDPKTGKPIVARYGRYGPMIQRGETESEDKPDFAALPEGTTLDNVTLEGALEMLQLPRTVGKTDDGQPIAADIGRFGPYIKVDKTFVSIKPLDPRTITEKEARELYAAKLEKEANKYIAQFSSGINIVNGPYGPYITDGKKNAKIPKETDPKSIKEAQAKKLLAEAPAKGKGRRFPRRKKTS